MQNYKPNYKRFYQYSIVFVIYILLRLVAWKYTYTMEDHDSISYLIIIKYFLDLDIHQIVNMKPEWTIFYPLCGALFSLPGWSIEIGARFASLFFSTLLFIAIILIGEKIAKPVEIMFGLIILSFSTVLIPLSFAILTEPSYIATIYIGLYFFIAQYQNPKIWGSCLIGVIIGLAFLNRVEGILYIAVIPFFQIIHFIFNKNRNYGFKKLITFISCFLLSFSIVVAPQIWRVSNKMGRFALNGREVWHLILQNPDGKSYEQKLLSLDYSPKDINLKYLMNHPEVTKKLAENISHNFKQYLKNLGEEYDKLYKSQLGILIGPICFIFFAFGISSLYQKGLLYEIFFFVSFVILSLVAPVMHNVAIRHIAVIGPIIMLIAGMGIVYVSETLLKNSKNASLKNLLAGLFVSILIGSSSFSLYWILTDNHYDNYYDNPNNYVKPAMIIKNISKEELKRKPIIMTRSNHIIFYSDAEGESTPYTDYKNLVTYCYLNNIDLVWLQHTYLSEYPFYNSFKNGEYAKDFKLIYEETDPWGKKIQLYRFLKNKRPNTAASMQISKKWKNI